MYTWLCGALLLLLTLVAHADERTPTMGNFQFRADNSLFADFSSPASSVIATAPNPSFYGGSEDSLRVLAAQQVQMSNFRERIYNSLGISHLIPRGNFMAGAVQASWHVDVPNRNTLELKVEARW